MLIVLASAGLPCQESAVSAAWSGAGFAFPRLLHPHLLQEFTLSTGGCKGPSPAAGLWHSLDAAERRFSAFPSCSDWRNLNPSTFPPPPPRALCFSGIIFNLYQAPDLAARGTVRTAEWAQWEGWEQGDGERKERKDGGRTAEANTFAEANVRFMLLDEKLFMCSWFRSYPLAWERARLESDGCF